MNLNGTLLPLVDRLRTRALVVGVVAAGISLVGAVTQGRSYQSNFNRAYLFSFVFFLGLALGSLAILMLHRQVGGAWGFLIRRPLEAGAMTLPLMAVLIAPILFDLENIYPWVVKQPPGAEESEHPEKAGSSESHPLSNAGLPEAKGSPVQVTHGGAGPGSTGTRRDPLQRDTEKLFHFKKFWLNPTTFTVRVAIYFVIWIVLAAVFNIGSRRQDETGLTNLAYGLQSLAAPGLVLYFLTTSFALIDWGMSLEPKWYSSIYGVLIMIGQAVSTMAFMICVAAVISGRGEVEGLDKPESFNDLGNLLLAFVMLWGYISFSQFLIIWAGNLTEEIPWYIRRLHGGWQNIGRFLMLFHFAVPFLILLSRPVKRQISWLWKVAALVLVAHIIDAYWIIAPSFGPEPSKAHPLPLAPSWLDFTVPLAMGGIWLAAFLTILRGKTLMVAHDPELLPALKQAGGH